MEKVIKRNILSYAIKNNLFSPFQFGFLPKKSCETQLLSYLNKIITDLDAKLSVDSIYLDFCKAFDSVCHKKLVHKLSSYGLGGNLLDWIKDFLTYRTQNVRIGNTLSSERPVISGVPQGSVLGPILFLFYINDITLLKNNDSTQIMVFADDIKIFSKTTNSQPPIIPGTHRPLGKILAATAFSPQVSGASFWLQ